MTVTLETIREAAAKSTPRRSATACGSLRAPTLRHPWGPRSSRNPLTYEDDVWPLLVLHPGEHTFPVLDPTQILGFSRLPRYDPSMIVELGERTPEDVNQLSSVDDERLDCALWFAVLEQCLHVLVRTGYTVHLASPGLA